MVTKIAEKVYNKIENEEVLCVAIDCGGSRIMDSVIPETVDVEEGIYIEGENLILNITNEEEVKIKFDEVADEFIIEQGNVTFYLQ